jgi:hypothetical protein
MKIIFFILLSIISGILIFTYVKISQPEIKRELEVKKEIKEYKKNSFFNFKSLNLPARELYLKVDLRKVKSVYLYKILIKLKDIYAAFNVREILDSYGIAYSILQKKKIEIYVVFKNAKEAEDILNLFKKYKLNIRIEKLKQRI